MRKLVRPPLWLLLLAFGIALYYLVPVFQEWRRSDWRETEMLEPTIVEAERSVMAIDSLGRPRMAGRAGTALFSYQYRVADGRFYGSWSGFGTPVLPAKVLYDPDRPRRSVLKTEPVTATGRFIGWLGLGLGGLALALRLLAPAAPVDEAGVIEKRTAQGLLPTMLERRAFRLLVITDLAVLIVVLNAWSWLDRAPVGLLERLDDVYPPIALEGFLLESHSLVIALSVVGSLGLLAFWRPGRTLYMATWCFWLLSALLGSAAIDYGAEALLRRIGWLMGGAILALSSSGPIGRAFDAGRVKQATGRATSGR